MIRLCLDVNVWIGHFLTSVRNPGAQGAASGLARAALSGTCPAGPVQMVIGHAMLDTLEAVMRRHPALAPFADRARDEIEAAAAGHVHEERPALILGGTAAYPLLDEEDAGVLNLAMARGARLLVTSNMTDFIRGPKARTDTVTVSFRNGLPDVVRLSHPKLPAGLVLASPFTAAGWLLRRVPMPETIQLLTQA